jgi:hypothetical protein
MYEDLQSEDNGKDRNENEGRLERRVSFLKKHTE